MQISIKNCNAIETENTFVANINKNGAAKSYLLEKVHLSDAAVRTLQEIAEHDGKISQKAQCLSGISFETSLEEANALDAKRCLPNVIEIKTYEPPQPRYRGFFKDVKGNVFSSSNMELLFENSNHGKSEANGKILFENVDIMFR